MFLILSFICVVGYMGFIKALWGMMQPKGLFDVVSGERWSKWLDKIYPSTLEKVLGGCEQCGSWWLFWAYFPIYFILTKDSWALGIAASIAWVLVYWFICSLAGLYILTYNKPKE